MFGMPPAQLPYQPGNVVDCMLTLSVYEGKGGKQLSGRVLELRPAGLGNDFTKQVALFEAMMRGAQLTPEQKALLRPERADIVAAYRAVQTGRWHGGDLQPLFAHLGAEKTGKMLCALSALQQLGLAGFQEKDGAQLFAAIPTAQKKDLSQAPIFKLLEVTPHA